jgi:competence protein ComEA
MRVVLMLLAVAAMAVLPVAAAAAPRAQQASAPAPSQAKAPAASSKSSAAKPSAGASTTVVNLNTATQAQLEGLPGVGPAMAQRILEYRKANGAFKKAEDLMNVKGLGEKKFLKLKPQITVGEKAAASGSLL